MVGWGERWVWDDQTWNEGHLTTNSRSSTPGVRDICVDMLEKHASKDEGAVETSRANLPSGSS